MADERKNKNTESGTRDGFAIENGVLTRYTGSGANVTVPPEVTAIGAKAFFGREDLVRVTLPAGLRAIGDKAFENCTGLWEAVLPARLEKLGDRAFSGCKNIRSAKLPDGLKVIPFGLFFSCITLETVILPESLEEIGPSAFLGCWALRAPRFPESLAVIGDSAFFNCLSMRTLHFPAGVRSIGRSAFSSCGELSITFDGTPERADPAFISICSVTAKRWTPQMNRLFRDAQIRELDTEDFDALSFELKLGVSLRFLRENDADADTPRGREIAGFLALNNAKLPKPALREPKLLRFMCRRRMIPQKRIELYLAEAERVGDTEAKALLLEYRNELACEEAGADGGNDPDGRFRL